MSPHEFRLYGEGFADKREDVYAMSAWAQANLMTMWCAKGKRVKSEQLFRRRNTEEPREFLSVEDMNAYMRDRIAAAESEAG